jgi:hypothetical protein
MSKPKHIGGETYYPLPEAAKQLGVSRMTMLRWVTQGIPINGVKNDLKVLRDPISGHYYVAETSITHLANRFQEKPVPRK